MLLVGANELERSGFNVARNLYGEAGQGLADDACDLLDIGAAGFEEASRTE